MACGSHTCQYGEIAVDVAVAVAVGREVAVAEDVAPGKIGNHGPLGYPGQVTTRASVAG
jgi:hypothetical protein